MNTSRYFKLGLFVLAGLGILLGTVLALGAGRLLQKKVVAETVMDESVDGLEVGAPVKYRGVQIGSVTSIAFTPDRNGGPATPDRLARYVLIDLALSDSSFKGMSAAEIDKTLREMTKNGLRARLDTPGLTGGVFVGLDYVEPAPPAPPIVPQKSGILFIPSAPSTMAQVTSAAEKLASDLSKADLPQVITHFDSLITNASGTAQHINQIVEGNKTGINSAVADLPAITRELKDTAARVDTLLHDGRVNKTVGNLADDSASAGVTLQQIRNTVRDLQTLVLNQQDDIENIIADLRRTADNLAAMSSDVRADPARLIFSQPPPHKPAGE
jgi:ABC-type transporter Mla subunit MlaD